MEGHRGAGTGSLGGAREGKTPASPVRGGRARDGEPRGTPGGGNGGAPGTGATGDPGTAARRVIPARVATRGDPGTGDDRGARDGGSLGELGTVGDPGEPRARVPNRRARDGGQVGSRDGDTRGRAGRGGNHSDRPHRPHGRLRNVEAGGVRRHDRRGRLHHTSPMSDTPFWSFVML